MKKRIVSMLLVLCLVLAQLPALAVKALEEPIITGISITVDGVTYTEGDVIIKPDSTISYTITGTNLNQQMAYSLAHAQGITSIMGIGGCWDVDATGTTLTRDYSDRISHFYNCDNFRVYYTNDSDERIYTDLYLTFDGGPEPAQITDLDFIVDGVTYTEGNVPISPGSEVIIVVHGTKLYNINNNYVIDTPNTYLQVECTVIDAEHAITYNAPGVWFEGAVDYPITYTQDLWAHTITSDITVTYQGLPKGPPEITGVAINVDGVTYTEGNVIVRPDSTVYFIVTGLNLDNTNQQQIIDTPLAYLPLYTIELEDNTTYPYVTYPSVFQGGTNYRITYTNDAWATTINTDIYVTYKDTPDVWTLTADTETQLSLTGDLYVDLNGFDLSGSIALNGHKVYGMDSATNAYTSDAMGHFSCTDENGNAIIPERFYTAENRMRYMTIETENGYTFHRFYMGITKLSLNPNVTGFGYKAEFYGDEMVRAQIQAIGYKLWLAEDNVVSKTTTFKNKLTLRLENFDVPNCGETPVNACVCITLTDGTVLESATVSYSMRQMVELINDSTDDFENVTLQRIARMIQNTQPMETWQVENILAAL